MYEGDLTIMKVAIVALPVLPVPAVKGGAVETLIEYLIKHNEEYEKLDLTIISIYDIGAIEKSINYKNTKFKFIKINKHVSKITRLFNIIIRKFIGIINHSTYDKKVLKYLKDNNFDKIIFEGYTESILLMSKHIEPSKIYMHIHHEAFKNYNDLKKKIFESCRKIITVSEYIKNKTMEEVGINSDKLVVLKNCTETEVFNKELYVSQREIIRKKYNIDSNEKVIMFTGRIVPEKGIKELILAFKQLPYNVKAKVLIVGNAGFGNTITTEYDDELEKMAKDINDKIVFTGFVHNSELPMLHSAVDIAVVPSIWDDPAPLVVFEAMSSGLPLIVTNSGGIPEYITGDCAITIKRDTNIVINLSQALEKLINDDELRVEMGKEGRRHALKYNTKTFYNDFVSIVEEEQ